MADDAALVLPTARVPTSTSCSSAASSRTCAGAAFCRELLGLIQDFDAHTVVTLGALLSDTPHTRPTQVTGTSYDPESAARFGLEKSRYEGPTGIVGVLQDACVATGIPGGVVLGRRAALRVAAAEP